MRFHLAVLSLSLGLVAPGLAYASPINPDVTFYLYNGTTNYGGVDYGSVTINTVTGTFVSEDIFVNNVLIPGVGHPTNYIFIGPIPAGLQGPDGGAYGGIFLGPSYTGFDIELPVSTLVGYTGGSLCTPMNYALCGGSITTLYTGDADEYIADQFTGYLSSVAPTPEPSSVVLLGTGMVGVAAAVRRRFRRR